MKKTITFTLIAAMACALLLAGCRNNNTTEMSDPSLKTGTTGDEGSQSTTGDNSSGTENDPVTTGDTPTADEVVNIDQNSTSAKEDIKSATLDSAMIQIGDNIYVLGQVTAGELMGNGCQFYAVEHNEMSGSQLVGDNLTSTYPVQENDSIDAFMELQEHQYKISLVNFSSERAELKDCVLTSITLNTSDENGPVYLPQGLSVGDQADITKNNFERYIYSDDLSDEEWAYTMYGFSTDSHPVYLKAVINKSTSIIESITYTYQYNSTVEEFASSKAPEGVFAFPYNELGCGYIMFDEEVMDVVPVFTDEKIATIENAIDPTWIKYYFGDITTEEYAEEIKPILEETGYYQIMKDFTEYNGEGLGGFGYESQVEQVKENVGEEAFNLFYWFL